MSSVSRNSRTARGAATALLVAAGRAPPGRAAAGVFTVTTTADSGPGSLRQAILDANALPGYDNIDFMIPGGGVKTIAVSSPLPQITEYVFIDGFSQPGTI